MTRLTYVACQLVVLGFVVVTLALILLFIIAGFFDIVGDLQVILS